MSKERKGLKLRRCAKLAPYYKAQYGTTDDNKKRRLRTYLRSNPTDEQARRRYEQTYGRADTLGVTTKGQELLNRAERRRLKELAA